MVAVPLQQSNRAQSNRSRRSLELLQGSLLARKLDRQAPWLGNLHRIADGSLVGLGVAVVGLSALTLHWQGRWTSSFQSLEATQRLEHRLQESAAVLEQHHLSMTRKPRRTQNSITFSCRCYELNQKRVDSLRGRVLTR